jgi:hypothetical protein
MQVSYVSPVVTRKTNDSPYVAVCPPVYATAADQTATPAHLPEPGLVVVVGAGVVVVVVVGFAVVVVVVGLGVVEVVVGFTVEVGGVEPWPMLFRMLSHLEFGK